MPIQDTARTLMEHELRMNPTQFDRPKTMDLGLGEGNAMTPLSPELVALLGGATDAASTYTFLKRRTGSEDNAMFKGLGNGPLATASGVMGSALAMKAVRAMMRKKGWDGLADTLAATQGNTQLGVAANNFGLTSRTTGSEQALYDQLHQGMAGMKR